MPLEQFRFINWNGDFMGKQYSMPTHRAHTLYQKIHLHKD